MLFCIERAQDILASPFLEQIKNRVLTLSSCIIFLPCWILRLKAFYMQMMMVFMLLAIDGLCVTSHEYTFEAVENFFTTTLDVLDKPIR